jgi:hypothetical protein
MSSVQQSKIVLQAPAEACTAAVAAVVLLLITVLLLLLVSAHTAVC